MGGPAKGGKADVAETGKGQGGSFSDEQVQKMKDAPATIDNAMQDFLRGSPQDAMDKLQKLEKSNPAVKDDPRYKRLRKHVEMDLS
jgi:predicted Zn-dependent protease